MNKDDFFNEAFKGYVIPEDIKHAAMHICNAYGIKGICDPMYIANVIAMYTNRMNEMRSTKQ